MSATLNFHLRSPVLSTTDATCDPARPLVLSLLGYQEFIQCCPTHNAHPSLSPETNTKAVCRASPLTTPAPPVLHPRRPQMHSPLAPQYLSSPVCAIQGFSSTPSAATQPPRLCTVEVRADTRGLPPARVVCLRGRGYGYAARWYGAEDGDGSKDEDERRPRQMCCTAESGPELGVAIRECALAVSAAHRSAGIVAHTWAVLEGEGVTAKTGAGECTGGREADTHPPRLKHGAHMEGEGEGEGDEDEDDEDLSRAALAASPCAVKPTRSSASHSPVARVEVREAELRLPFFTEPTHIRIRKLSPYPHHTRSRPRSRTITPTRSLGRESAACPPRGPPLALPLSLSSSSDFIHTRFPFPVHIFPIPIAAIPARNIHRARHEGGVRASVAHTNGAAYSAPPARAREATPTPPPCPSPGERELSGDDDACTQPAKGRAEFDGVTSAGVRSDARRGRRIVPADARALKEPTLENTPDGSYPTLYSVPPSCPTTSAPPQFCRTVPILRQ
ncbi:hypothetical protein B0H14DRAFT_3885496 [Mycena olivaceomarginata]|nr:hypothetical protein B0H14DRAFT_3885496 [Mycena olivaceomarginata]